MFTADRQCQVGPRLPPALGPDVQKFAHAIDVKDVERVLGEDALLDVGVS